MVSPHNYISFDIETIGRLDAVDYIINHAHVKADSRLKDPAKIEKNIEEKRQKLADKAVFHWWSNQVVTISAVQVHSNEHFVETSDNEVELLTNFYNWVHKHRLDTSETILFGHNSEGFDCPVLVGRSISLDIGIPYFLRTKRTIREIDDVFGYKGAKNQGTNLANVSFALGIDGKTNDGSEVAGMFSSKMFDELSTYCLQDSKIPQEFLRRYLTPFFKSDVKPKADRLVNVNGMF